MELSNEEGFPDGTAGGIERTTFDLEPSGIAQKKKARHANVAFALGAAVSRGPT